ncbi:MAG: hypothetical protein H6814_00080 [Phycisphaeraceae bacterium]|nr:hypothetical protein [Phycisphaeraceae bacterium]
MSARTLRGLAIVAGLAISSTALAGISYSINPAVPDSYGPGGGHAFWFPDNGGAQVPNGGNATFQFVDDSGVLTFNTALTSATMTGRIASAGNPGSVWDVEIHFILGMSNAEFTNPMGHLNPNGGTSFGQQKRELHSNAYIENGGPVDPATWRYFYIDESNSNLTGVGGAIEGVVLDITQRPGGNDYGRYVFQVGEGANGKNIHFGASTWFSYSGAFHGVGDINIDLKEIPAPGAATLAMLAAGIGGSRRRRR